MNIKESIEKLNSMNISELKNIDIGKLKEILRHSPKIIANLVMIAASIFAVITLFNRSALNEKKFKANTVKYEEKLKAVKNQENIKQQLDNFTTSFPKSVGGSQLIDKFSELASSRNVHILSFSPTNEKSNNFLHQITVDLSIESNDYKNIILFVKDIEDFPFALRLEKFSARLSDAFNQNRQPKEKKEEISITAEIEVSSLKIK